MKKTTYATNTLSNRTRVIKANVPDGIYKGVFVETLWSAKSRPIGSARNWDWM